MAGATTNSALLRHVHLCADGAAADNSNTCAVVTALTIAKLLGINVPALVILAYNLEFTLEHYAFDIEGAGWENFYNSLMMAGGVTVFGA